MLAEQRHAHILAEVASRGTVTVTELAQALGISESTVRRDLEKLDQAHKLTKVHGGAVTREDAHVIRDLTLPERAGLHDEEKARIVRYAASLVEPDDFVYIDAGSTTQALIEVLTEQQATYVTDSVTHAQRLVARGFSTVVLGGELKAATQAVVGPDALDTLSRYHFTLGFWGTNGITREQGCTTPDRGEAQIKRVAIEHTARPYIVTDASKFGRVAPVKFAELGSVTVLTTTIPPGYEDTENITVVA